MTTIALTDCCTILGIDPKTLRHWLKHASMSFVAHPTDARLKCLTELQVQQLATLHGRPLPSPVTARPVPSQGHVLSAPANEAEPFQTARGLSASSLPEAELTKKLSQLETQVATLQEQLARLTSLLIVSPLAEFDLRGAHSTPIQQQEEPRGASAESVEPTACSHPDGGRDRGRHRPHPAESRRRPVLPLIEYDAGESYVVICPQEGELSLVPDSPEWFAWLASLSSFRFVGKLGRLSATREYDHGPKRSWMAYRCFHQHTYKHYLGTTERLTIATLEQMAAKLQSYVTSL
jgi:hypothetical protein